MAENTNQEPFEIVLAQQLREDATPEEVRRAESRLMDGIENGRLLEELRRGKRMTAEYQGFVRAGRVLELRATLKEVGPKARFDLMDDTGKFRRVEMAAN